MSLPTAAALSEPLDIESPPALIAYLRRAGWLAADETPAVRVLAGGVSNRTVWVGRASGEAWVLKQALPKLRVPVDWFSSPARIGREALGLRWLGQLLPPGAVPRLVFEDLAPHLLAMTAVPEPHENWKLALLAGRLEAGLVGQCAGLLAAIHREAAKRTRELKPIFADRAYFESLRLEPYFGYAATQFFSAAKFLQRLIADTRRCALTLVHGDFSPKNLLIHDGRLVLLDHEVIHWGDPTFDVGFVLTHFLSKAHHLPAQRRAFAEAARALWRTYRAEVGGLAASPDFEPRAVRQTLGCLLARVAGRSPLEYLDAAERTGQREAVLRLLNEPPSTLHELIRQFIACLPSAS